MFEAFFFGNTLSAFSRFSFPFRATFLSCLRKPSLVNSSTSLALPLLIFPASRWAELLDRGGSCPTLSNGHLLFRRFGRCAALLPGMLFSHAVSGV